MSADDMRQHGVCAPDFPGETLMLATFEDGHSFWYTAKSDGSFWAMACNVDELFTTADAAALWVRSEMMGDC